MALIQSLEKNGNFLFKYRGQFPIVLFLLAIPVIYTTNLNCILSEKKYYYALLGFGILVSFLGQTIRAIAIGTSQKNTSGRNKDKQIADALNTTGIYSTLRHPLYLGNYFMWIGIIILTGNIWFVLCSSLLFWVYYERIMFAEERFLEKKFGEDYLNWSVTIPPFIPSFKNYKKSIIPFSFKTVLRREYSGISATIIGFLFIDFFQNLFYSNKLEFHLYQLIIFAIAIAYSLIFRTLKHKTKILFEEDRS